MKKQNNRQLHLENLESRQLMAGDLYASMTPRGLTITESIGHTGEANYVAISKLANGLLRIDGRDAAHSTSNPINGAPFVDFLPPLTGMNITVTLGGGNDTLRVMPGTYLNNASFNLGGPGADVDTVDINGLKTRGALSISTGGGVDNIFLQNSNIGDGTTPADTTIDSGAGIDYVQVGNTNNYQTFKGSLFINTCTTANEAEIDRVLVELNTVRDFLTVSTGAGDDTVTMLADTAGKDISLLTGDGDDKATLRDCSATDNFYMLMGNGNDLLDIQNLRAFKLYADGGAGLDTFRHAYDGPTGSSTNVNFEYR
jgi:hypothetical protein